MKLGLERGRLVKVCFISAFAALICAVLAAWSTPNAGFEISIYRATPILFWICYGYSVVISILILVSYIRGRYSPSSIEKYILGFLIGLNGIVLTSLHLMRGYLPFDIMGDVGTHIGNLHNFIDSAHTSSHYPGLYLESGITHLLTGADVFDVVNYHSIIGYILLLLGCIILARSVYHHKSEIWMFLLIISFFPFGSSMYVGGSSQAMYVPYLQAVFMLPLFMGVLFIFLQRRDMKKPFLLLSSLLFLYLTITHILLAAFALIFVICIGVQYVISKNHMDGFREKIKELGLMFIILSMIYIIWIAICTSVFTTPVRSVLSLFLGSNDITRLEVLSDTTTSVLDYPIMDILEIFMTQFGILFILGLITMITIPYVYKNLRNDGRYRNLLSLSLFAIVMIPMAILPFISRSFSFESARPMKVIVLIGALYAGIYFSRILCKSASSKSNSNTHRIVGIIGVILLISLLTLSIVSVYSSYEIKQEPRQVTDGLIMGMEYYITHQNPDYNTISNGFFTPARFAQALYHNRYIRSGIYEYTYGGIEYVDRIPNHYNYHIYPHLGETYATNPTYLADMQNARKMRKQYVVDNIAFRLSLSISEEDDEKLHNDNTVHKIFTNPDIIYYLIYS